MSWGSLWPGPPVSEDECAPLALRPPFPEGSIGNNCCALHQPDPLHPTPFPNRTRWSALLLPGPHTTAWSSRGPCSPPSCSPGSASVCRGFDGLLPPPEQVTRCGSREGTKSALALPLLEILLTPPVLGKCCILRTRTHTHTHVLRPTQPHLSQDTRAQPPCLPIFPVAVELIPASPHLPPLLKPAFPAATHPDRPRSTSFFLPGAFTRAGTNSHGCPSESSQTRVSPRPCDTRGTHLWKSPPLGLLPAAPGTQIWV